MNAARRLGSHLALAGLAAALAICPCAHAAPPNVVVVIADDMGWGDVGVHGATDVPTPNLDAIAAEGVRFANGYVSGPQCSPARAGLLTGRYQERFGHEFNLGPHAAGFGLPLDETTLADRMKAAGYATGLVGKWHLGLAPQVHPLRRGFDEFFGFLAGTHPYLPGREPLLRGIESVAQTEHLTDAIAREAIAFVARHRARPFFLLVAFNAVHGPPEPDPALLARFGAIADPKRRAYVATLAGMDLAIGRLVAALRDARILDETLLVFLSDNGGWTMPGNSQNGASNAPFRGSKRTLLEGGIRVPFFVRWPARLPKGAVFAPPVIQLDLVPTVLAAAGIPAPPAARLDGVDLLAHLAAGGTKLSPPHEALYWRFGRQMAIRRGDWKLVRYDRAVEGGSGLSDARLYDLARDPGEWTDLAAEHPDVVRGLRDAWDRWNAANARARWRAAPH